ncbi:uncharacterized protein JCM6883_007516 [Sporobolomyces salmoneus]|uniref:uncharacterized protein n=1 Tax=Sporobolomyces salmoneus TaxID=183962 RepID=UPI00316D097D
MTDIVPATLATLPSHSSPPSLTTSSSFSKLPTELIQHIIESAIPLQYHSETYNSRQKILRSFCLVSKLFYEIARPLLFAIVVTRTVGDSKAWKAFDAGAERRHLGSVEELNLWGSNSCVFDWPRYTTLRLLVISGFDVDAVFGGIDLANFAPLPNLTTLRLNDVLLRVTTTSFVLPRLRELELCDTYVAQTNTLTPLSLPALRYLFYSPLSSASSLDSVTFLSSLAPQLELASLDYDIAELLQPEVLKKLDPITLWNIKMVSFEALSVDETPVSYLRLEHYISPEYIGRKLENAPSLRPALLYVAERGLNTVIKPDYRVTEKAEFASACEELGIRVVWEDLVDERHYGQFSTNFRERVERQRIDCDGAKS